MRIRSLRISPLGTTIGFLSALMISSGAIVGSESIALWGVTLLTILVIMHLHARLSLLSLATSVSVTRRIPRAYEGDVTPITIDIHNRGIIPVVARIMDTVPQGIPYIDKPETTILLMPGSRASYTYRIIPRPGTRCFGAIRIRGTDLLGLFEYIAEASVYDMCISTRPVPLVPLWGVATQQVLRGEGPPRIRHRGVELYQLREYVEGDDAKLIEWKATARTGRLIVKQTLAESMGSLTIVFAADSRGGEGEWLNTPFEKASRTIAKTILDALSQGNKVKLIVISPAYKGEAQGDSPQHIDKFLELISKIRIDDAGRLDERGGYDLSQARGYKVLVTAGPSPKLFDATEWDYIADFRGGEGYEEAGGDSG